MTTEKTQVKNNYATSWLYYFGKYLLNLLYVFVWRRKVAGHENVPERGGVIIATNHLSLADPPLIGCSVKRAVYFFAKKELFRIPILSFIIKRTNAFPVERGRQDISAFRNVIRLLKSGRVVLIFPEGTRSRDGNFGTAKEGVGMISCLAQVPVVPTRIINSNKLFKLARFHVIFGKPVYPPKNVSRQMYQEFSEKIMEEIKKLRI